MLLDHIVEITLLFILVVAVYCIMGLHKRRLKDINKQLVKEIRIGNLASRRAEQLQGLIFRNVGILDQDSTFFDDYDKIIRTTDQTNAANI